jgi:hypothetical protein
MTLRIEAHETVGLVRPASDVHTLGMSHVAQLLRECGVRVVLAGPEIACTVDGLDDPINRRLFARWINMHRITRIGFSYRLDPGQGKLVFDNFFSYLWNARMLSLSGGAILSVYCAGLPDMCEAVRKSYSNLVDVFCGDDDPVDTLKRMGVPAERIPLSMKESRSYDLARASFGRDLVRSGRYASVPPPFHGGYSAYGSIDDNLTDRISFARKVNSGPVFRSHVGPFDENRNAALKQFNEWMQRLARSGYLDVVSIGTSQLTQERFGQHWEGLRNGGGVPINSESEYQDAWRLARPMLMRTYAGTRDIVALARMHDATIYNAWHALSLWWFCRIDGRGPNSLELNLREHVQTLDYIASVGKPYEPNVSHQFAFRGSDDITYVLSAYLAAKTAKLRGVRTLILQIMLNTPRYTWGLQDLAKARATLQMVRRLEDVDFHVVLQSRAGLDYFSADEETAKAQLSAATAMMDDIDPKDSGSPSIIHVVGYTEAVRLADPSVIDESIKITLATLEEYRRMKGTSGGWLDDLQPEIAFRTEKLLADADAVLGVIEREVKCPYTARGLYAMFAAGFLPVPFLWGCRDLFCAAVNWETKSVNGGVSVVDASGRPMSACERAERAAQHLTQKLSRDLPGVNQ